MSEQKLAWCSRTSMHISQFIFLAVGMYKLWEKDWIGIFVVVQAMVVSALPYILKSKTGIHIPHVLRIGISVFMFMTLILGEIVGFYTTFAWWDIVLHGAATAGLTLIGFILLLLIFSHSELKSKTLVATILSVSFALALAVVWEVYEFLIDILFAPDPLMQLSNTDTMTDLMISIVGALVIAVSGYRYIRWKERGLVGKIIEEGVKQNDSL
ncbi:hypothetical protein K2Q16_03620 [Patescibacteria group bacterium]|nr:hypothetical protein [Patescibacteria group bacterium]